MVQFVVFENADIARTAPVGEILVGGDGALTLTARPESPAAGRLGTAVEAVRQAGTLTLRSESQANEEVVMTTREVSPGDPVYAAAVADTLSRRFGLRCVEVEEVAGEEW